MTKKLRVQEAALQGEERKEFVREMFDSVAEKYDLLNHVLSMGIDVVWRKRATKLLKLVKGDSHLDLACGTGDFAIEVFKTYQVPVIASDFSNEMLKHADIKFKNKFNSENLTTKWADAEDLPFDDNSFTGVTIGFGIRNFGDKEKSLTEIFRVLKKSGRLVILEFSTIRTPIIGKIFELYFKYILPRIASLFTANKKAYTYLPDSVDTFPDQNSFCKMIELAGFQKVHYKNYHFGIASVFYGEK
jgi:demethylmenaquinone methyltransferase / 2-methoxy-6-polyprenyl-1,4-benzoquinol methylase